MGDLEELDQNGTCTDSGVHCPHRAGTRERLAVKGGGLIVGRQALAIASSTPQPWGPPGLLLTRPSEGSTLR